MHVYVYYVCVDCSPHIYIYVCMYRLSDFHFTHYEVKVTQLCLTLCNCVDCSPPGSSIHGISRQEYWSGLPFPSPTYVCVCVCVCVCVYKK